MTINFNELTLFNPALYYDFDPEDTGNYPNSPEYGYLIHGINQKIDMATALLYAQQVIYPEIQKGWNNISPEQLIGWIKEIHKRCAKTLLPDECGDYPPSMAIVLRWHLGCDLYDPVCHLLNTERSSPQYAVLFTQAITHSKIADSSKFEAFLGLLRQLAHREDIILPDDFVQTQDQKESAFALKRLQLAYNRGQLSDTEKELVQQFVIVCLLPEQLPDAMQSFATETIQAMLHIDPANERETIQTLAEIFYHLVSIHPFINGNGRADTIFFNLLMVSLGFPSVVLRYPGDKENPESPYRQAMDAIEHSRSPLAELILNRIHNPSYTNPLAETIFHLQLQINQLCQNAESYFEQSCVIAFIEKLISEYSYDKSKLAQNELLDIREEFATHTLQTLHAGLFSGCALFAEKNNLRKRVLAQLNTLTRQSSWKCKIFDVKENHRPICAWIECPLENASSLRTQVRNQLNTIIDNKFVSFKEGTQPDQPNVYIIRLDILDLDGLFQKLEEDRLEPSSSTQGQIV